MNKINDKVTALVAKYGTRDPFVLCAELNIIIVEVDLPDGVNGFFQRIATTNIIYINNRLDAISARNTCAHELAHALLHEDYNVLQIRENTFFCCEKYEREADIFAAHLLIPAEAACAYAQGELCREQLACISGVTLQMVELRYA